jgi:Uma2 family endonuclease
MLSPTLLTSENDVALLVQDEPLYEIVDGQRVDVPPMSVYTTWLASRLHGLLWPYVEEHGFGTCVMEMLFILDAERNLRRRPDVAFVSADRWPLDREIPTTGDWDIVPDLAVEVISPNDIFEDVLTKLHEYFQYGVQLVWAVVPEAQQVYVYDSPTQVRILTGRDTLTGDKLLPDFHVPLARLFQRSASTQVVPES